MFSISDSSNDQTERFPSSNPVYDLLESHIPRVHDRLSQSALLLMIFTFSEHHQWPIEHLESALLRSFHLFIPALSIILFDQILAESHAELILGSWDSKQSEDFDPVTDPISDDLSQTNLDFRLSFHKCPKFSPKIYLAVTKAQLEASKFSGVNFH